MSDGEKCPLCGRDWKHASWDARRCAAGHEWNAARHAADELADREAIARRRRKVNADRVSRGKPAAPPTRMRTRAFLEKFSAELDANNMWRQAELVRFILGNDGALGSQEKVLESAKRAGFAGDAR